MHMWANPDGKTPDTSLKWLKNSSPVDEHSVIVYSCHFESI